MTSFLPARQNFPIWRGATFHYRFQWLNDNGIETKAENVSGFTGACPLKSINGTETFLTLTNENGGIIFNGESGLIDLIISSAQTSAITWNVSDYNLLVINPHTEETLPLLTGRFSVKGPTF
jgi:hypothetical protein